MVDTLFVFAPGAGAPSTSAWMRRYAELLERLGKVHAFDYDYMKQGRRTPDPLDKLIARHRAVLLEARSQHRGRVVLAGKSMGGRIGCHLALEEAVDALVCFGYPLRAAGKNGALRDRVLIELKIPILFVQGTRDPLCPLDLLDSVRTKMTAPNSLYVVEGGNHSLEPSVTLLRARGQTSSDVEAEIVREIEKFVGQLPG